MPSSPRLSPAKQAIVDAFGECDRQLKLWKPQANPHQAEHDKLEAEILSWQTDLPADQSKLLCTPVYEVGVSARGFQRIFTAAAQALIYDGLTKIEGLNMLQFFSITLADVQRVLGKPFLDLHVPKLQTGPRKVTVVPRAEAVRKAA